MAVKKINIDEFLELAKTSPVFDVRSPGEYLHAHIPGASNLPLFTDEERKQVGTTYKQKSREVAIKSGLDFFGPKMRKMVEEAESVSSRFKQNGNKQPVLVHCWRGGMRSAGVAWLLDLYGFSVYTLAGGYKAYRAWVRKQFEKQYQIIVIGGYTGSGKTPVLLELKKQGKKVVDLEAMACHKGSAFGAFGEQRQPRQEMFENLLAEALVTANEPGSTIFVEDESHRIGDINVPMAFWNQLRENPLFFLEVPFEARLDQITQDYGKFEKELLINSIIRIQKRLGGLDTKTAINFLIEENMKESFRVLLRYYDKWYEKGLYNRENLAAILNKIPCAGVDTLANTQNILHATSISQKTV